MKAKVLMFVLFLSIALFIDYLLLAIIGCSASNCGAGSGFFCSIYCILAGTVIVTSTILPISIAAFRTYRTNHI